VLKAQHAQTPRVINVDKNAAYPMAMETLKGNEMVVKKIELRQSKYLNNVIEQDHRNIKRVMKSMMEFKTFNTARRALSGIGTMNTIGKGQVKEIEQGNSVSLARLIESIFGITA
jgi:IS6 family transposase